MTGESFVMFGDLQNPRWIIAKGGLFLLAGALASGLLLADVWSVRTAILHGLAVWCFCRFYYFAFYVIEHYVDPQFKFAGLGSALVYLLQRRGSRGTSNNGVTKSGDSSSTPTESGVDPGRVGREDGVSP